MPENIRFHQFIKSAIFDSFEQSNKEKVVLVILICIDCVARNQHM
jgi:hypothetical protein